MFQQLTFEFQWRIPENLEKTHSGWVSTLPLHLKNKNPWTPWNPWKMKVFKPRNMGEINTENEGCGSQWYRWMKHPWFQSLNLVGVQKQTHSKNMRVRQIESWNPQISGWKFKRCVETTTLPEFREALWGEFDFTKPLWTYQTSTNLTAWYPPTCSMVPCAATQCKDTGLIQKTPQGWNRKGGRNVNVEQKSWRWNIWVFPKIVISQNGWLIMENPIKMHYLEVPLFFGNAHMKECNPKYCKLKHVSWCHLVFGFPIIDTGDSLKKTSCRQMILIFIPRIGEKKTTSFNVALNGPSGHPF